MLQNSSVDLEFVDVQDATTVVGVFPLLSLKVFTAFVDGYSVSTGGERPTESISFTFAKITGTTTNLDALGNPKTVDSWTFDVSLLKG